MGPRDSLECCTVTGVGEAGGQQVATWAKEGVYQGRGRRTQAGAGQRRRGRPAGGPSTNLARPRKHLPSFSAHYSPVIILVIRTIYTPVGGGVSMQKSLRNKNPLKCHPEK